MKRPVSMASESRHTDKQHTAYNPGTHTQTTHNTGDTQTHNTHSIHSTRHMPHVKHSTAHKHATQCASWGGLGVVLGQCLKAALGGVLGPSQNILLVFFTGHPFWGAGGFWGFLGDVEASLDSLYHSGISWGYPGVLLGRSWGFPGGLLGHC